MASGPLPPPKGCSGVAELIRAFRGGRSSPVDSLAACLHRIEPPHRTPRVIEATRNPVALSAEHTMFAYFGLPAISVPCGFDERGLPLGLQIVGKPGGEVSVLQLAYRYQNAAGFAERRLPRRVATAKSHRPFAAKTKEEVMDASNLLGSFIWYDQMSNDLPGSERFYSKVVGWTLAPNTMNDQRYTLLKAGEAMIGGLMPIPEHAAGIPPAWMGYVAVDDVAAYADKVKATGGAIHRGPTEIPNVGTFAVAGDPDGAGFLLFRGLGSDAPAYDPTGLGHVGWRELNAGDGEKVFGFYAGLFGWTKTQAMPMGPSKVYQLFATGSGQEGAVFTKDADTPHPFWRFYFTVDAVDAASERVKAAGGKITNGPMEVPGNRWIVHALDPQGAAFALVAPKR